MRVPCQLADIYEAVKRQLIAAGICTDRQQFITLEPEELQQQPALPPNIGLSFREYDQFPTTLSCEDTTATATTVEGELTLTLWLRMALEPQGAENIWLTEPKRGLSEKLRQLKAVFDNGVLTDLVGDQITWRQLIFLGFRNYGRGRDQEWRRVDMRLDCCYEWEPSKPPTAGDDLIYAGIADVLTYSDNPGDVLVWG